MSPSLSPYNFNSSPLLTPHNGSPLTLVSSPPTTPNMSSLSDDHHHHLHHHSHSPFSTKNVLKDINLPPRKLLLQRSSPKIQIPNETEDYYEEESDPYSSDEFRMYEFKIRRCMRSRSHDWTDCPFAHPGEKARRRDPRRFHYSGNPCADFRHGTCPRGDSCEFAHGVFECWLHPARYRTHACKDGKGCTRKICFFAHTPHQLRVLPLSCSSSQCSSPSVSSPCCGFCHSMASSPTSTLMGLNNLSPPLSPKYSPPISPSTTTTTTSAGYSLLQRFNEAASGSSFSSSKPTLAEYLSYKKALMDLVNSLDNMNLSSIVDFEENQTQFFLSPTATTAASSKPVVMSGGYFGDQDGMGSNSGPDLDWVDELVM